jgi:mevalonate kinase
MTLEKACGKIILGGEHAVVYEKPGIALPVLEKSTIVSVSISNKFICTTDKKLNPDSKKKLDELFEFLFEKLKLKSPILRINIESSIPIGSGMGSSASLSIALIKVLSTHYKIKLSPEEINKVAFECEKIFHGSPSGIDNTVLSFEKPIFYEKGNFEFIRLKKPIQLIIANTGKSKNTKEIVISVRERFENNLEYSKIFDEIETIVRQEKVALEIGDIIKLGKLMTKNHSLLQKIKVSNSTLDKFVDIALCSGAYGAKLAGAGLGGNIIALVDEKTKEKVFEELNKLTCEIILTVIT